MNAGDYARRYVTDLGEHVLPLAPGTKAPYKGTHGVNDATNDVSTVTKLWADKPESDIGIVHGKGETIALDFDYRHEGYHLQRQVEALLGESAGRVPTTATGDGNRLLFLRPSRVLQVKQLQGLDIFGNVPGGRTNNYTVEPPSLHPNGLRYEWIRSPFAFPPFTLPADICEWLAEQAPQTADKSRTLPTREVREGKREAAAEPAEQLYSFDRDERFVQAWCQFMDVPYTPEKAFHSPIRKDRHPSCGSCCIHKANNGTYRFHDFTQPGRYYALCEVYAAKITGRTEPLPALGRFAFSVWQARLLLDLGWLDCPAFVSMALLPQNAPAAAKVAYNGFRVLLQARSVFFGEVRPAPYSHRFCATWTGLSEWEARTGVSWLIQNGYLLVVGKAEGKLRANLFMPRNQ